MYANAGFYEIQKQSRGYNPFCLKLLFKSMFYTVPKLGKKIQPVPTQHMSICADTSAFLNVSLFYEEPVFHLTKYAKLVSASVFYVVLTQRVLFLLYHCSQSSNKGIKVSRLR